MVRARSSRLVRHGRRVDCGTSEYSRYVPSRIAAVVVTHNRSGVLLNALRAIAGQTRPPDALYVVDNASEDDTAERLQREFPAAVYLRLHDNAGAAGGVAAGMRAAYTDGFDGFWLMDDDSEPEPQALESLLTAAARASTRTGIIGFGGGVLRFGVIRHLHGPQRLRRRTEAAPGVYRVDFTLIDGALVLRRVVEEIGFPRTDFFMMIHDVEYPYRAHVAGFEVLGLERDLLHRSHLGSTGSSPPWRAYYQTRNHLRWALDMRSPRLFFGWALRQIRLVTATFAAPDQSATRIRLRGLGAWDALHGRMGRVVEPLPIPVAQDSASLEPTAGDLRPDEAREGQGESAPSRISRPVPSRIAAVVVTHNRSDAVVDALRAMAGQTRPPDALYVVDNASEDDTAERLRRHFPGSVYLRLDENVGYGAGLAAGMRAARANGFDGFWLMDDDSEPEPHALESLLSALARSSTRTGIIGFGGGVLRLGAIRHLHEPRRLRRRTEAAPGVYRVDFTLIDGALVPSWAVDEIGFPRTDFFMMMEDVEYSLRAGAAGLDVLVIQRDLLHRKHLGSTGSTRPWRAYYQTRNHLRFALDMRSPSLIFGWLVRQVWFGAAALRAPDHRATRIRLRARGAWDGLRGRMGRVVDPVTSSVTRPSATSSSPVRSGEGTR